MLGEIVDEAAERWGDATAYVTAAGWSLSYRDLARHSRRIAGWMASSGIGEGDVVALVLPAGPEYLVCYLAAARVGAITAGINTRLAPVERDELLDLVAPRVLVSTADLAPNPARRPGTDHVVLEPADRLDALLHSLTAEADPPPLAEDPQRRVAIVFTSGTTGLPKAAVFCNRQLAFITETDTGGRWGGGGGQLSGTSLTHLGPMTKLPGSLMRGGTAYLVDRWRAEDALELTARHRMAIVAGIPTQVALMLRQPDFDSYDLSAVRAIVIGGGPSTPALVREARRRFDAALSVRYSCTEAGIGLGTALDAPSEDAEVSVGRPHAGVTLELVDENLSPVPSGEVGEVCLGSPAVMSAYWNDPEATAAAFTASGAVRTGDLGRLDAQGRLILVGRRREMYVRGGYNVFPVEVEAVLATHPSIAEVAIVPATDDVFGEVGIAVVVPRPGSPVPTLAELRAFGTEQLGHHKLPDRLEVTDALPLTSNDKLDRQALADRFATAASRPER